MRQMISAVHFATKPSKAGKARHKSRFNKLAYNQYLSNFYLIQLNLA